MAGTLELPAGLGPLVATAKWSGFYADAVKLAANPFVARAFMIRANHKTFGAAGVEAEVPLVCQLTGTWKKLALGTLKPQEAAEYDDEIACSYLKLTLDGDELVEVDVYQNIWRVGGEDILAPFRQTLGGA
jgi:hypothetical protein